MKYCVLSITIIATAAAFVAAPVGARGQLLSGEARLIHSFPDGDLPEGIAVDPEDGAVYVGNRSLTSSSEVANSLWKINDDGSVFKLPSLLPESPFRPGEPESNGLLGLATHEGDVFAALDSDVPKTHGVYKISRGGNRIERLAGSENIVTPNAIAFGQGNDLYVTDSKPGAIWRFDLENINDPGEAWVQDDLLTPDPDNPLGLTAVGANGIAYADGSLFVANTSRNSLVRVGIGPDGAPAKPEKVAGGLFSPLTTIDGIAADPDGNIQAVIPGFEVLSVLTGNSFAPVVNVDPDTGEIQATALHDFDNQVFDTPLSVTVAADGKSLFATNGALPAGQIPPNPGPGVVQVGLGGAAPSASPAGVPEPSTALLLILAAVPLALRCPRMRKSSHVST